MEREILVNYKHHYKECFYVQQFLSCVFSGIFPTFLQQLVIRTPKMQYMVQKRICNTKYIVACKWQQFFGIFIIVYICSVFCIYVISIYNQPGYYTMIVGLCERTEYVPQLYN